MIEQDRTELRNEAYASHQIEGYTFDTDQKAMFEMFDRANWSDDQRRAFLLERAHQRAS